MRNISGSWAGRYWVVSGLIWGMLASAGRSAEMAEGNPLNDPKFFPLCVWVQSPGNAEKYKAIGVNTYVALWRGPTEQQLNELEKAGMYVICHQNEFGRNNLGRKSIIAWMHGDEPDNAQPLREGEGKGWGPPILPSRIIEDYKRIKSNDPSRPVFLNLGQGVAWDQWHGRGTRTNHPEDYPEYVKGCDIASFDIYPVTHDSPQVKGKLEYVARGVERLRGWTEGKKPVWACIETTHISNEKVRPTAEQIRSEVWLALVHGARGIVYFCHEFKPKFIEAGLLAHADAAEAVKKVNGEIMKLAPVLNSETMEGLVNVESSNPDVPIAVMVKRLEDRTYIFAMSTRAGRTKGSFTLAKAKAKPSSDVEVLNEGRALKLGDRQFQDEFEGYGLHIYRVDG